MCGGRSHVTVYADGAGAGAGAHPRPPAARSSSHLHRRRCAGCRGVGVGQLERRGARRVERLWGHGRRRRDRRRRAPVGGPLRIVEPGGRHAGGRAKIETGVTGVTFNRTSVRQSWRAPETDGSRVVAGERGRDVGADRDGGRRGDRATDHPVDALTAGRRDGRRQHPVSARGGHRTRRHGTWPHRRLASSLRGCQNSTGGCGRTRSSGHRGARRGRRRGPPAEPRSRSKRPPGG